MLRFSLNIKHFGLVVAVCLAGLIAKITLSDQSSAIVISGAISCIDLVTQAEDGVYAGGITTDSNHPGFNGVGFANYPTTQGANIKITWTETVSNVDSANMIIRYALGSGNRSLNLYVNSTFAATYAFPSTGGWTNYSTLSKTIAVSRGVNTFELVSDAGTQGPNVDEFYLDVCTFLKAFDYGDLPDSTSSTTNTRDYQTLEENGGPKHLIIEGLMLGDTVDANSDGLPNNSANGDDLDSLDDEDGLQFLSSLDIRLGRTIRLPLKAKNTTGDTAYIFAWADWNGDGAFDNISELAAATKDAANGVFPPYLEINIPNDALTNRLLGFRVRLSNEPNLNALETASSGEIEDYLLEVQCQQAVCLPINTNLIQQ